MLAVTGSDRQAWRAGVGYFAPDSPMASETGMESLTGMHDLGPEPEQPRQSSGFRGAMV
jgi:peptide/nickel transport system substrate-binding protein